MIQPWKTRPTASLSLDLDNKWSYLKTHGNLEWQKLPSYLPIVIPRVLKILREHSLSITWFIVGQDAVQDRHRELLRSIVDHGHEVGNHSFHHEPWLHLYSKSEITSELVRTEDAIEAATGIRPSGFRGPGYSLSQSVLEVLLERGYRYDASTFPTYLGPIARAYYFMTAKLTPAERKRRAKLFGTLADGHRPLKPYRWRLGDESLLEIPVTTLPLAKIPLHLSYLLYLGRFSRMAARNYFRTAMMMCRSANVEPSILLHPLDFLGCDDDRDLSFFPAMDRTSSWKLELANEILDAFKSHYDIVPMGRYAELQLRKKLPFRRPDFAAAGSVS